MQLASPKLCHWPFQQQENKGESHATKEICTCNGEIQVAVQIACMPQNATLCRAGMRLKTWRHAKAFFKTRKQVHITYNGYANAKANKIMPSRATHHESMQQEQN